MDTYRIQRCKRKLHNAIEGGRLRSGHEVIIHKLKMQSKTECVKEGATQGAQRKCWTTKHDKRRQRHNQAKET